MLRGSVPWIVVAGLSFLSVFYHHQMKGAVMLKLKFTGKQLYPFTERVGAKCKSQGVF